MAKVKAFTVDGIEMWFYSGDHEPPHFHARKRGKWQVRVYILRAKGSMIEPIGPPGARIEGRDRKSIQEGVASRRWNLLKEWEACQAG